MKKGSKMSDEQKMKISIANSNPSEETRQKKRDARKKQCGDKEPRLGCHCTPETKQKISLSKIGKPVHSEETKKRISEQQKGKFVSLETRKKISNSLKLLPKLYGPQSHNWKNGSSFGKYCWKFNKLLKNQIKENFNYKCFICGVADSECKKGLYIHHIDFNTMQGCFGKRWALIPLCGRCHNVTRWYKHYSFNLLVNYWIFNNDIDFNNYIIYTNYKMSKERNLYLINT